MINKDKLDKIANTIIEEMGDLKLVKQTMVQDDRKELMSILIGIDFVVTFPTMASTTAIIRIV